ncbi:MAG: Sec-independent protein translocase protein TatB [Marinicellaceae bacterium]
MFDVGFSELFMIMVISLIVIGPERLPGVAKKIGKYIGKAKRTFENVKREVQSELETEELNKRLAENNILKDTKKDLNEISEEIKKVTQKGQDALPNNKDWKS